MSLDSEITIHQDLFQIIVTLSKALSATVTVGEKKDEINHVITTTHGETTWETFNHRMDILFGEDLHDSNGRFGVIWQGKCGMDTVCNYLCIVVDDPDMLHAPMVLKLE
ncbi:hypothetical protein OF83DRAFT_1086220 [Amylostereum chailletii]|nr:hypothetical protein OF83DRAFT_1086220 [Amylostereum chailletii]